MALLAGCTVRATSCATLAVAVGPQASAALAATPEENLCRRKQDQDQ